MNKDYQKELEEATNTFNFYVSKARNKEHLTEDEVTKMLNAFDRKTELEKNSNMVNKELDEIRDTALNSIQIYFGAGDVVDPTDRDICAEEIAENIEKRFIKIKQNILVDVINNINEVEKPNIINIFKTYGVDMENPIEQRFWVENVQGKGYIYDRNFRDGRVPYSVEPTPELAYKQVERLKQLAKQE